jgi:hypothetical protein
MLLYSGMACISMIMNSWNVVRPSDARAEMINKLAAAGS